MLICSESGEWIPWSGLLNANSLLKEGKYLVHDRFRTLQFVLDVKSIIRKNKKVTLLFLLVSDTTQQTHAKIIETKYSRLVISTIAHDLKTPVSVIQGNLYLLNNHIHKEGIPHLDAALTTLESFKHYLYDLVVNLLNTI
jgi:K+-sensing histidine kinase KdpD